MTERKNFIVLVKKPGINALHGVVENSFSLGFHEDRTRLFWSGPAYFMGKYVRDLDGKKDAQQWAEEWHARHPECEFAVWDAHDESLPVEIDWEQWEKGPGSSRYAVRSAQQIRRSQCPIPNEGGCRMMLVLP